MSYLEYVFLYFYLIYTLIFFINILFIIFFLHIFYISITTPTQTPSFFTFQYSHNCSSLLSFISSQWPSLLMTLDFCGNVKRRLYLGRSFTWAVFVLWDSLVHIAFKYSFIITVYTNFNHVPTKRFKKAASSSLFHFTLTLIYIQSCREYVFNNVAIH